MTDQPTENRLRAVLITILRILVTVVLAVGLGAGLYFGTSAALPRLRARYIQPVEENTSRLNSLSMRLENSLENIHQRLDDLSGRITQDEIQLDQHKATQSALVSDLTVLDTQQTRLQETIQAGSSQFHDLENQVAALSTQSARSRDLLSYLATQQIPPGALSRQEQVTILRELLLRAKVSLHHENYGQARVDLEQAVALIDSLQTKLPRYQLAEAQELQSILVTGLEALAGSPELAADALELAWRLTVQGFSSRPQQRTPTGTEAPRGTPAPLPSRTPTPTPSG
jgi:hypothetical protein